MHTSLLPGEYAALQQACLVEDLIFWAQAEGYLCNDILPAK
ncbi:hypothetical protein [Vagococcus sp. WN89Y]